MEKIIEKYNYQVTEEKAHEIRFMDKCSEMQITSFTKDQLLNLFKVFEIYRETSNK